MKNLAPFFVVALAATGCVSQGRYDRAVAQTETTRAELQRVNAELRGSTAELQAKDASLVQLRDDLDARAAEIAQLKLEMAGLDQLARARSGDVAASRGRISELQARLADLEAAQRAAEARAALYRDLTLRLKKQIDDGNLSVVVRNGRMVLQLPNDVLFDTGRTEIKPAGKGALRAVAAVMKQLHERQFQVSGHTDDVPIKNDRFASNWELSSGRALGVVHFLIEEGADPRTLSAAGYGEIDPISPNATVAGKKQNRRTEITLQPNIDELVKIP